MFSSGQELCLQLHPEMERVVNGCKQDSFTVKPVLKANPIKQTPVLKASFSCLIKENECELTCIKQASVFSSHFLAFP